MQTVPVPGDEIAELWKRVTGLPIPDPNPERRIIALIKEAADLWVEVVGDEDYRPGETGISAMKFPWIAELVWTRSHQTRFPDRWSK